MQCPQCHATIPDEEWNCPSCRINVYWASRHFEQLAALRGQNGLRPSPTTPAFLISCSRRALEERAERTAGIECKVREIARREMRGQGGA
jgi:hypothetical protein